MSCLWTSTRRSPSGPHARISRKACPISSGERRRGRAASLVSEFRVIASSVAGAPHPSSRFARARPRVARASTYRSCRRPPESHRSPCDFDAQLGAGGRKFFLYLLPKLQNLRLDRADSRLEAVETTRQILKVLHLLFEHCHSLLNRSWGTVHLLCLRTRHAIRNRDWRCQGRARPRRRYHRLTPGCYRCSSGTTRCGYDGPV
jgi:hypothetical protein